MSETKGEELVEMPFICCKCKRAISGWERVRYSKDMKRVVCIDCVAEEIYEKFYEKFYGGN